MLALRYVYVLALVVWLGGMVVLGALAAPTTFEVLQRRDPAAGRALAGDVFGQTIARFHYVAYATGVLLLGTLVAMRLLGPKPAAFGMRCGIIAGMLALTLFSGFVVLPGMEASQRAAGRPISELAASDDRRRAFEADHRFSERLMLLTIAGALVLLYWEAREK
jgi:uncharacterized membrane protein